MSRCKLLPAGIEAASDLQSALVMFRDFQKRHGVRDLVYAYMLQGNSHIRNDLVFIATLPDTLMKAYYEGGGLNNDPMADEMEAMTVPTSAHFKDLIVRMQNGGKFRFRFAEVALEMGYTTMMTTPVLDTERFGIAGVSFYQESRKPSTDMDEEHLWAAARAFHTSVKAHGQLAEHFGLSPQEIEALSLSGFGRSAEDIADVKQVTPRTIEMRLQSARKKLKAKTTTEAVYRCVAYGILPIK